MFSNKKLAVAVSGAVLLMAGQFALADSTTDIVDALVSKGVLTEEEGKLISKGHETKKKAEGTVGFKDGFKINSGDGKSNFSVNGRIQSDYRYFDTGDAPGGVASGATNADTFDIRRAYLTAKGNFRNFVNYEATLDGAGSHVLKYYWLETAFSDKVKVRFGQYKMPGSLEQLTSSRFIDFTERDWVASMAPAVNKGIMIHGVPMPGLTYAASYSNGGYLADSGAGTTAETGSGADGKAINGRLTANIAEFMGNKETIAHIGGWYGRDDSLPTMAAQFLSFRTNARGTVFFSTSATATYTNPDIDRGGLEFIAAYGPFKASGEVAKMNFSQQDQADKEIQAHYINLSWLATGETYASAYKNGLMDRLTPKNNFTGLDSSGLGAIEFGLRYSKFNGNDFAGNLIANGAFGTASATNVHSWAAGAKWIIDPNTRFLFDYVYTDFGRAITGYNASSGTSVTTAATQTPYSNEKAINFRAQFDF